MFQVTKLLSSQPASPLQASDVKAHKELPAELLVNEHPARSLDSLSLQINWKHALLTRARAVCIQVFLPRLAVNMGLLRCLYQQGQPTVLQAGWIVGTTFLFSSATAQGVAYLFEAIESVSPGT